MKHRIMTPQELNQIVQDLELKGWITLSATEPNNIVNVHPTAAYNRITDSNLKETSILMPIDLMRSEENIKAQLENLRDSIKKQAFNVALGDQLPPTEVGGLFLSSVVERLKADSLPKDSVL